MSDPTPRIIVCATAYGTGNPYADILYGAVEALGVEVWRRRLVEVIRLRKPRGAHLVVHLHWTSHIVRIEPTFQALVAAIRYLALVSLVRLRGISVVWTLHNAESHDTVHPRIDRWVHRWMARVVANRILVMAPSAVDLVASRFGSAAAGRTRVVPHPTYEGVYPTTKSRQDARNELGLAPSDVMLLFFGRILPYKGVTDLVQAVAAIDDPRLCTYVVGEADAEQASLITSHLTGRDDRLHVEFGRVDSDDVNAWFAAADWVVLPYRKILNSGVALLAITHGTPVIAPRLGALPEVMSNGGVSAGILYDPADGVEGAIRQALREGPDSAQSAAKGLAATFAPDRVGSRLIEVYEELAR